MNVSILYQYYYYQYNKEKKWRRKIDEDDEWSSQVTAESKLLIEI
jgi:hypothetical protein